MKMEGKKQVNFTLDEAKHQTFKALCRKNKVKMQVKCADLVDGYIVSQTNELELKPVFEGVEDVNPTAEN